MSTLTPLQAQYIEAVAAQLHDRDETSQRHQLFWPMIDETVRQRYRNIARRKLKTGEIDGWFKTLGSATVPSTGKSRKDMHQRAMIVAAE